MDMNAPSKIFAFLRARAALRARASVAARVVLLARAALPACMVLSVLRPSVLPAQAACESLIAFGSDRSEGPGIYVLSPEGGDARLLARMPGALGIEWSPVGGRIAFLSVRKEDEELFAPYADLRFHAFLYVVNTDGTDLRRVSDMPVSIGFSWSPDGTRVAFASSLETGGGNAAIYVVEVDGGGQSRLTDLDGVHAFPSWSSDGRLIAFGSKRGGDTALQVMSADGTGLRPVVEVSGSRAWSLPRPVWSLGGRMLAFAEGRGTYIVSANGGDPRRVDTGSGEPRAWLPDRRRLLMAESSGSGGRVFLVDVDAIEARTLASDAGAGGESSASPLWDRVAYTAIVGGQADVYLVSIEGGPGRNLTKHEANDYLPAWSPCTSEEE